jgi:hypothetical protein
MEDNQTTELFNLNLRTLESLHQTIEQINECSLMIAIGHDKDGRSIYAGDVLRIKHKLISLLLTWTNVLITDGKKFNLFVEEYKKIQLTNVKVQQNNKLSGFSSTPQTFVNTQYVPETENAIDELVNKICRELQTTGIFKKKANDPSFAINN